MTSQRLRSLVVALTLSGCALSGCAHKSELPTEPIVPAVAPSETEFRPSSGLRVLVQEDQNDDLVYFSATYNVGGGADPVGAEGLAHLVEHLWFRSRPGGGLTMWELLTSMGAKFNASTSHEQTTYHAIVHKDAVEALLDLEAWRLSNPLEGVTPEVLATEREVVRNELRQRLETTVTNKQFDMLTKALFPKGHPMHRPVVGTHESLSAITLDHARAFVKKHYRPENLSIFIGGKVDREFVKGRLDAWPGALVAGPPGRAVVRRWPAEGPAPAPPAPPTTVTVRTKGPVAQTQVYLAWSLPGAYRGDDLLRARALSIMGSGLFEIETDLESQRGRFIQSTTYYEIPMAGATVLVVGATLRPGGDPEDVRDQLMDAVLQTRDGGAGRRGSAHLKLAAVQAAIHSSTDLLSRAPEAADFYAATGKGQRMGHKFVESRNVDSMAAVDYLQQWMTRDRAATVIIEPEGAEGMRTTGTRTVITATPVSGNAAEAPAAAGHYDDLELPPELLAKLGPQQVLSLAQVRPRFEQIPTFDLPNGMTVVAKRHGSAPIARIELRMRGGDGTLSPYGTATFAYGFARRQCVQYGDLWRVLGHEGFGIGLQTNSLHASVFPGNLANGVAVLSEKARCQVISEMEPRARLNSAAKARDIRKERPEWAAHERLTQELYPQHPYGVYDPDPQALGSVDQRKAEEAIERTHEPRGAVAFAIGQIEPLAFRALVAKYFDGWSSRFSTKERLPPLKTSIAPPPPPPAARKVFVFDRPNATQATVTIGCRLPNATAKTIADYEMYEQIVSKMLWSLREKKGATYGLGAYVTTFADGTSDLRISGSLATAQATAGIQEILAALEKTGRGEIDVGLFVGRRWALARDYNTRFVRASSIQETVLDTLEKGWPLAAWNDYPRRLAFLKPADVAAIGQPCAGHEIVVAVGDAKVLRLGLTTAGLQIASAP